VSGFHARLIVAWLASIGVGCTSAPIHYYTLTPSPDETLPVSATTLKVDVRAVHTPPQLNRAELMVRTGPTEVTVLENERWASPVNDEIKDALRLELRHGLDRMTGLRPDFSKLTIDIDVQRLEAEFGRYALIEASWSATLYARDPRSNSTRVITCAFEYRESIRTGYAGMVEGYQREIATFADTIVAALTSSASGIDAPCQKPIEGAAAGSDPKDQ
jgi:uncharacterized lipoprotein YmbA